MDSHLATIANY